MIVQRSLAAPGQINIPIGDIHIEQFEILRLIRRDQADEARVLENSLAEHSLARAENLDASCVSILDIGKCGN